MHPALSFGFKNGPIIPQAALGYSIAAKFKSGQWHSEISLGTPAINPEDAEASGSMPFGARWMQFLGASSPWKPAQPGHEDPVEESAADAITEDFDVSDAPGVTEGEGSNPLKALLDALFDEDAADDNTSGQSGEANVSTPEQTASDAEAGVGPETSSEDGDAQPDAEDADGPVFEAFAPVVGDDGVILHDQTCPCPGCGAREEESVTLNAEAETSQTSTATSAATATLGDMADYLTSGYWADKGLNVSNPEGTLSHNLGTSGTDANNGVLYYNLSGFSSDGDGITEDRKVLVREAFKLFEATLGIDFEETTSTNTSEVDFFFSDNSSGAWANYSYYSNGTLATSYVNVSSSWSGGTSTYNDYTLQTIFHEIGHALGLGHQGNYNGSATFGVSNNFANDSWQASMMSYFSQSENTNVDASGAFLQTPMSVDWMALDALYGSQGFGVSNAFTENTTWGFNTTVTSDVSDIWAQWSSYANKTASTIVDGGGIDTLDLSGYSNNSVINLAPSDSQSSGPSVSSIGGKTGNLTIAEGTIIENAIGGSASETFYGNIADNVLSGNGGNDTFHDSAGNDTYLGGAGTDTALFSGNFSDYSFAVSGSFLQVINVAVDLVEITVEWLGFADQTVSYQSILESLEVDTNTAPDAENDSYTVDEDGLLSGENLLANDTDADGNALSVASVNGSAASVGSQIVLESGALLTVNADGTFSYDQNGAFDHLGDEETATETFTYVATDGEGNSEPATVTITVEGVHDNVVPVSNDDGYTVGEDGLLSGQNLLANDTDADGNALSVASVNGSAASVGSQIVLESGALLTVNADGTFSYDQNGAFDYLGDEETATETFTYVATDGEGNSEPATVTITVEGVHDNNAPVSANDSYTVDEDGLLSGQNLLANDTDADGNALSVASVNGSAASVGSQIVLESGALLTVNADGTFSYDQNGAFDHLGDEETATETFSYVATDGEGNSEPATVTITVEGVHDNSAPVSANDSYTVDEDGLLSGQNLLANDTDANGDALTVASVNGSSASVGSQIVLESGALLTVNADGTFSYDQNGAFDHLGDEETATETFTYVATDGEGNSEPATVTITVEGVHDNSAPVSANDSYTVDEDGLLSGQNLLTNDTDADGDALTVASVNGSAASVGSQIVLESGALLTVNADGTFSYDQNGAFDHLGDEETATETFTYVATDGEGNSEPATVTITVEGVHDNSAPVSANDSYTVDEDALLSGQNLLTNDTDADGNALSVASVNGSTASVGSQIVLDSGALLTVNADGTFSYDQNGAFDHLGDEETATETFSYVATDGEGNSEPATVTITVEGVHDNSAPVSANDSYTVDEDGQLSGQNLLTNDTDADGNALSVASVNGSSASVGSQIVLESGALLTVNADGTFSYDQNGAFDHLGDEETATETFTYVATDGEGNSEPATVTITVEGVHDNSAPVSANDSYTVYEDGLLSGQNLLTNDTDANGDALTVASVNGSAASVGTQIVLESGALLTVNADGTFSYDQNGAFDHLGDEETATETFTYVATDGEGNSEPATVTITVEGVHDNSAPSAGDDTFNVAETGALSANLLSNDTDPDNDTLTIVDVNGVAADVGAQITLASGALLTVNADGTFDYDPNGAFDHLEAGETGADSFSYRVSDGNGGFDTATVNLSIDGEATPDEDPIPDPVPGTDKPVVIDFEGLAPGEYGGEAGFSLSGVDVTTDGQLAGNLSGATNGFTISADGADFDLDSILLQSVTRRARITVEAYDDGVLVGTMKVRINSKGAYELELDERFDSVDEIVVSSRRDKPFYIDDVSLILQSDGSAADNQAPVAADDRYTTGETVAVSGNLLGNDSDPDGGEMTLQTVAGRSDGVAVLASGAIVTFASDGTFTYDPNGAFDRLADGETATDVFVYEVSDGSGGTDTAEVEITVEGDGTAPVEMHIGFEGGLPCRWFDEEDEFVFANTYVTGRSRGVSEGELAGRSYGDSLSFARADGESFDFEEATFTALGWRKATITVEGYLDGELVGVEDFRVRANREKSLSLSDEIFDEVDEVVVTSNYGVILDDMTMLV